MENILAKLNWKILLAVAVLIFILIVVLIFISSPKKAIPTVVSPTPTSVPTATPITSWKIYQGPGYLISAPPEIAVSSANIQGGGKGLIFESQNGLKYNLELQVIPNTITSVEKIAAIFKLQSFDETVIYIDGIQAKKFAGSLKFPVQILQESAVVFERDGEVYKFQIGYVAPARNKEIDDLFSQVYTTFRFDR